ncbi:MAG: multiple resistance and pH regulation protein F [Candidatus Thiosymbion ectosymbiont of Robbea hypermnestra]|nr:multiple resistance and pH regulation protein F [Candidatus Thiosymbion ectosymbiont of Robbea hypermnestra]
MSESTPWLLASLLLLLLSLMVGLARALRGPTLEDRMLSVQLLGTGGVGILLLTAVLLELPALLDVSLVLALLAAVAAAALTRPEVGHD